MIPTPLQVVQIVQPVTAPLRKALRKGIDHADYLQPDPESRDSWYWSHSARWKARNELAAAQAEDGGWGLLPNVPNSGIHLTFGLHTARLLRSLGGTTPHPGPNRKRLKAYQGVQGQLPLADGGTMPILSLIMDWQERDGEPEVRISLPYGNWKYQGNPLLHWRIPLPEDGADLSSLTFDPGADADAEESLVTLAIDPAEMQKEEGA